MAVSRIREQFVYSVSHAQIGIDDLTRPGYGQIMPARLITHGPGKDGPAELVPCAPAVAELDIFPDPAILYRAFAIKALPGLIRDCKDVEVMSL